MFRKDNFMIGLIFALMIVDLICAGWIIREILSIDNEIGALTAVVETIETRDGEDKSEPPVEEETPVEVIAEPVKRYFDIPLDRDLQNHIIQLCDEYEIEPELIVAMMKKESNYRIDCVGDGGNSLGLLQIQSRWHRDRMDRLGVTDLLDPYQNLTVGVDYLAEMIRKDRGIEWALMAYNGGPSYANKLAKNGIVSEYASDVLNISRELERVA